VGPKSGRAVGTEIKILPLAMNRELVVQTVAGNFTEISMFIFLIFSTRVYPKFSGLSR
jgi:hypothetical protein